MHTYSRAGKWYAEGYYIDSAARRMRWRRSTGIRDDGTARSAKLAEHAGYQIAQSLAAGLNRKGNAATVKAALATLIRELELAGRAQPTIDIVLQKSVHLLAYFGNSRACETITTKHLQDYARAAQVEQPDGTKGRKVGTVSRELRTLAQAMRAAGVEPPELPDLGRVYRPRERWLDTDEQRKLVAACAPGYRDHVLLYLQLGLRKSELYRLDAPDLQRMNVRVRGTKTDGSDRTIPLSPDAAAVLRRRGLPLPKWGNHDRDLKAACIRAGIEPASLNSLRHSYATTLARAGASSLQLAALLGHKGTRMLERVYAHLDGSGASAVALLPRISVGCVNYGTETVSDVGTVDGGEARAPPK